MHKLCMGVSVCLDVFGTPGTERGFGNDLETFFLDRRPAVRAQAILTFLNALERKVDARNIAIRMRQCLLSSMLQNA